MKPSQTLKILLISGATSYLLPHSTAHASTDLSADQIRTMREMVQQEKEAEAAEKLTPEERKERQASIDADVQANFSKRNQMRPSDRESIPPECDEWLKLYKETGWGKAKEGIKETCP